MILPLDLAICYTHLVQNRSEEHTSEPQSPCNLVCRLLLEKKNKRAMGSGGVTLAQLIHGDAVAFAETEQVCAQPPMESNRRAGERYECVHSSAVFTTTQRV